MPAWTALLAVAALIAVTLALGWALQRRAGRARAAGGLDLGALADVPRGERATLVQFSTAVCARCPQVRRMLRALAGETAGVEHADVDLTHRGDLARRLHILQTPTVFLVDDSGFVRARFSGAPTRDAVARELHRVIGGVAHV